ncbi:IS4 family transposase [Methyloceanibacter sp.]|uniref:IS4 family transposase n=1 Tax=Methyloceanibacter sp. TaxID=1965321 RepID=UPI003D6D0B09
MFGHLLEPISRRWFNGVVDRHDGNAYDKRFKSWDHLAVLIYAQLGGIDGLRGLETVWNAHAHHHYHLGVGKLSRSTLADANVRRPTAIFIETFSMLSGQASGLLRRESDEMLRLIDATPIPLGQLVTWAKWNGRARGLKLHVVYDPAADNPTRLDITHVNVNDVEVGRQVPIEAGHAYIYDKAYCSYDWWMDIHQAGAQFVTRSKINARYKVTRRRALIKRKGDGFKILKDQEVRLISKNASRLPIVMRRVRVKREDGGVLVLITNDLRRSAVEIAALYKKRWQIELLFRWIKQHLKIRTFFGRNENAIRLQILAAMIAYVLLRIVARQSRLKVPIIRFADLLCARLFTRAKIEQIDKPPDVNPAKRRPKHSPDQLHFCYA